MTECQGDHDHPSTQDKVIELAEAAAAKLAEQARAGDTEAAIAICRLAGILPDEYTAGDAGENPAADSRTRDSEHPA